ncbi:MAG TPA: LPXTG cell wall anchor domain-containing protein [Candidatus Bathyarchaeia archaeon]|nr:LPXTG cell wall anchor domain-containing protein [Candidatus Bathyarchaeia archaeon]
MRISKQISYVFIAFGAVLLGSGGYLLLRRSRHRHLYANSTFYQQNYSNYTMNQNYAILQHHGFGMFRIISIALVVIGIVLIAVGLFALRRSSIKEKQ